MLGSGSTTHVRKKFQSVRETAKTIEGYHFLLLYSSFPPTGGIAPD